MMKAVTGILAGLVPLALGQGGLVINPQKADDGTAGNSMPVDLSSLVNNRGFGMSPGDANYDGLHSGYPAQYLPPADLTYSGVKYNFPQYKAAGNDNVLAQGQILTPPKGRYFSVHMLAAAESAIATGSVNATYADNTTSSGPLLVDPVKDWPYPYGGDIIFPYSLTNESIDYNRSMIFQTINWLDSSKELVSLQLPNVSIGAANGPGGAAEDARLHIFAVTLVEANGTGIELEVQYARSTQMWVEGTNKTQIVEVTINNIGDQWVLANSSVKVSVDAAGLKTVTPAVINRLRPGDQAIVQIGVVNSDGTPPGTTGPATVEISLNGAQTSYPFNATYGIGQYEATYESIYSHESPMWYNDAKYGIFIHWGVYSVPGWGNVGGREGYAEWYWWDMNQGPNTTGQFYEYNLATYGPDHVYDDFIQNFTASIFDPKAWVDLFADAGAEYFVQVSKHHDGYAIFDLPENVTERTSVKQFPHRNLLQELFDASREHQPQLHTATYYSLPEWFNPAYAGPGGNATNPYTNATLPYAGFVPVEDYVQDIILPQMQTLADMGTEIMWCDIGGPNLTAEFASSYFNNAAQKGKQVSMNNRCGLPGDFDTPEYAKYNAVQVRKWESNLGLDPFSYGYNRATPDSAYLTPQGIVTSLMDIISKNGNFLLDVGPTANGTIIAIEQQNLRAAGQWIKEHAEAIYGTRYWFVTPEEGDAVRFTQTSDAFYITTLYPPNATLVLDSPVPYVSGDQVTVVGGNMSGTVVPSMLLSNGSLQLTIPQAVQSADRYSWVFKIPFGGVATGTTGGVNSTGGYGGNATATYGGSGGPAQQTTNDGVRQDVSSLAALSVVVGVAAFLM
ncbi:hypothetical protein LTR78_008113 [Recurvomyces mirabilis]|uniref:alpha-L-fucosidase n=2 Tax=Recurvomyces mirabilis TaxID=574656 RepID=A0AAE0WFU1_9PEZI|nr:hypothetical protein LTR78_008113 [Recurvomyces mirabilis]